MLREAWDTYVLRQIIEKMSLSLIQRSKCAEGDVRFSYLIIFGFFLHQGGQLYETEGAEDANDSGFTTQFS